MKCKGEFSGGVRFRDLKCAEAFRWKDMGDACSPLLKLNTERFTNLCQGGVCPCQVEMEVVRIRIDRVEDGVPVFVDA